MTSMARKPSQPARPLGDPWLLCFIGAALVALPAVIVSLLLVLPADADVFVTDEASAEKVLAAVAAHPLGSWLGLLLVSVVYLLMVPALLPLVAAARGRGRALVRSGYVLVVVGAVALAMENAVVAVTLRAADSPEVPHDAAVAFLITLQQDHGPLSPLLWAAAGTFLGPLLLVPGSIFGRNVAWWQGLLAAGMVAGMPLSRPGLTGLAYLAVVLAAVASAIGLLRTDRGMSELAPTTVAESDRGEAVAPMGQVSRE